MSLMPTHEGACAPAPNSKNRNATTEAVAQQIRTRRKTAAEFHDPVIGHGDRRYRVDKLWCKADPAKLPVQDCHEMVQSGDGRLFLLTNHPQNNVLIFDRQGAVLGWWTLGLSGAHGLTWHREASGQEFLYITDTDGRVLKMTLDGKIALELPHPAKVGAYTDKDSYIPTETAVAPNGDIYVADGYGSQYVLRFGRDGAFIGKFGGRGVLPDNPAKFMQVHGVALDQRGDIPLLICTERIRNELSWFTLDGKFVRNVYLPGAYLNRPVIKDGYLYSAVCFGIRPDDFRMWQNRGFITILDKENRVVSNPGGHTPNYARGRLQPMLQDQPVFCNCHDVCVDDSDDLYVCQWNSANVYPYKLHREG